MAYIGTPPADRFVASKAASVYSGNGSTTAFTLEHAVGSDEDILVSVDGVIQEPSVAYAVSSGTTLTFTGAPSSNSGNNIFVYYLFRAVGTVGHPSNQAFTATTGTLTSNATVGGTLGVTGATTLSSDVTIGDASAADKKILFDGNAVDYHIGLDDSADSLIIGKGSALGTTTSMAINANGHITKPNLPSFLTYGTPTMTATSGGLGYFHSFSNSGQSFDNGSNYNNSTGRFTCPVAGKYMFGFSISRNQSYSGGNQLIYIGKNGNTSGYAYVGSNASGSQQYDQIQCHFIYDMAANDFAVPLYYIGDGSFSTISSTPRNYFYGFLIG